MPKPAKFDLTLKPGDEVSVLVDYQYVSQNEDEAYAEIFSLWYEDQCRFIGLDELTDKSADRLQTVLDEEANDRAHELFYERQACRAFDRAKDLRKYGE